MLLPAVDVAGGRAAQALAGSPDDPLEVAQRWVAEGADLLHLVDLDAAHRRGDNAELLGGMVARLDVPVQLSGGIDTQRGAEAALATGAMRVNLASSALLEMDLVRSLVSVWGPRIVVGIDVRPVEVDANDEGEAGDVGEGGDESEAGDKGEVRRVSDGGDQVVARGSGVSIGPVSEVAAALVGSGVRTVLVADAARDGSRRGVDLAMFARVADLLRAHLGDVEVVASGGVATLMDLEALRSLAPNGVGAVVLGSALHHGVFTLAEARAVVEGSGTA